ncbi:hypothetical protein [Streptomyces turgidiscabies]|uniref:hypothetical protein n=1 Tax=Streptomyces turgidiscabies TaxID=85558 RepID=UPI0038F691A3
MCPQQEAIDQVWTWEPNGDFTETSSVEPGFMGSYANGTQNVRGLQAVSANGRLAVTQGQNPQLQIWDLDDFASPVPLAEFTAVDPQASGLSDVALSGDGALLIAATEDGVQVRDVAPLKRISDNPTKAACQLADGGLTQTEWDRYLPGLTYEAPCAAVDD